MKKKISIIGSTGSIGTQTIDVVKQHKDIEVVSLCCKGRVELFEKQARFIKPKKVSIFDKEKFRELKSRLFDTNIEVLSGMQGINELVTDEEVEMIVSGISGMIGIEPTISAIKAKKDIALANKETLVCAGDIVMNLAREHDVDIIPVDSEHSAIYQCLENRKKEEVEKLILTASGGPFRGWNKKMLENATVKEALNHPNWDMGPKITIDSSTLINKGLEVIEAAKLFGVSSEDIEVVIHPQSIIHSMVQFRDGAIMAQLGTSSMKVPIQYAIYKGKRKKLDVKRVNFFELSNMSFEKPNLDVFSGLQLCIDALNIGGTIPAVLNAANEIAVEKFLNREISYLQIIDIIRYAIQKHKVISKPSIEDIYSSIAWVKEILSDN